jgi:hypothetical protein
MDDTAQNQNQTDGNVQPQVPIQSQPQPQATPVGAANKEIGVVPVSEFVKPSEKIAIDKEVTDAGIVEAEREIKVEEEHERMGIRPSAESTPVKTEPTGMVQLPMTQGEIKKDLKRGPVRFSSIGEIFSGVNFANSIDFLAALLNKIHRKLTGQPA